MMFLAFEKGTFLFKKGSAPFKNNLARTLDDTVRIQHHLMASYVIHINWSILTLGIPHSINDTPLTDMCIYYRDCSRTLSS